jgi:hypothetical protein
MKFNNKAQLMLLIFLTLNSALLPAFEVLVTGIGVPFITIKAIA